MSEFALTPLPASQPAYLQLEPFMFTIYDAYPRKVGKRPALMEIARAIQRLKTGEIGKRMSIEDAVDQLLQATALYARSPAGNRGNFTPHPSTWFHQSRYLDNPDEWFHQTEDERLRALNNVGVSQWRPS